MEIGLIAGPYHVYILTNSGNSVLYVGVTSDLINRCLQHRQKTYPNSFTAGYNLNKLVYYERFDDVNRAIAREKQLKAGSRVKKLNLINAMNPRWRDLFETDLGKEYIS